MRTKKTNRISMVDGAVIQSVLAEAAAQFYGSFWPSRTGGIASCSKKRFTGSPIS